MTFKKLALASAIALVPTMGFSAQELTDETLSSVTGQDGIEIDIATTAAIGGSIYLHDRGGLANAAANAATHIWDGAIVISGFSFNGAINMDIDAGDSSQAGTAPVLNVNINIPTATIVTGDISVANSQRDDVAPGWGINTNSGVILSAMTIAMTGLTMNVQLGNEPQGNMILVNSTITGGLTLSSFALNDAGGAVTGGAIGMASMNVIDSADKTDLDLNVGIDANASGLVIDVNTMGNGGIDARITDMYFGTNTDVVGDVTLVGLNLAGATITISGK